MKNFEWVLNSDEKAVFNLRSLYKKFGYSQYKMSKFEEYDLYVRNKDFLVSDNIITFTDTDGKLMALKPDVTLSIIKNDRESAVGVKKVYYNEHVYRVSKGTESFKEIMQVGLECLGSIDDYLITEVLYLAAQSLDGICAKNVLDISHLDILFGIMSDAGISESGKKKIFNFLAEKNVQGVKQVCEEEGVCELSVKAIELLATTYGQPKKVFEVLDTIKKSAAVEEKVVAFKKIVKSLCDMGVGDKIRIDFSVDSDVKYYNGVVFKGFVSGIPNAILSGGQYDKLMDKMNKKSRAIGFAVYLDDIDAISVDREEYDVDVVVKYTENSDQSEVAKQVKKVYETDETVIAIKDVPEKFKYKKLVTVD